MMNSVSIDPIYGNIPLPQWLIEIKDREEIRRMMFIRQLGLKASISFPGAIHTRYSHSLGSMHLAGKIARILSEKATKTGKPNTAQSLRENENTIMAAAFLHDIGHGPFSHVLDYPLKNIVKKTHEDIASEIIKSCFKYDLEKHAIPVDFVAQIIQNSRSPHYQFICGIVNGQLDADKIDYILRDSYHVGLKYSFDADVFTNEYVVLGDDADLSACQLGLEHNPQAIRTAEIYILIWKNLYDLVYYIPDSRIAEKMLEKAILVAAHDQASFKELFTNTEEYSKMSDNDLDTQLKKVTGFPKDTVDRIYKGKNALYHEAFSDALTKKTYKMSENFLNALRDDPDALSEDLSKKIADEMKCDLYRYICDIIPPKTPKEIRLNKIDEKIGEPETLAANSPVIRVLEGEKEEIQYEIKVYTHPDEKVDDQKRKMLKETLESLTSE
jgi:HD superfamily phosphohydrolase